MDTEGKRKEKENNIKEGFNKRRKKTVGFIVLFYVGWVIIGYISYVYIKYVMAHAHRMRSDIPVILILLLILAFPVSYFIIIGRHWSCPACKEKLWGIMPIFFLPEKLHCPRCGVRLR